METNKKTRIITLVSHYYGHKINLRITEDAHSKLLASSEPMDLINGDLDRVAYGYEPRYISVGQARKVNSFFAKDNTEYFDRVVL